MRIFVGCFGCGLLKPLLKYIHRMRYECCKILLEIVFFRSFTTSSERFSEPDAANIILFPIIKVFAR